MAPSFGRSISFPLSPARATKRHVRSISLPCSSHPLLAHLHTHIAAVRRWLLDDVHSLAAGLAHIHALHAALADLLLLPDPQRALRRSTAAADRLLDAFLALADAHRAFHEAALALRHDAAEARAALRRGDAARLASAVRSQRRAEKELSRLAATVSSGAKGCARLGLGLGLGAATTAEEAEMAGALVEAAAASAAASAAVFSAAASMSAAASFCKKTAAFAAFAKKATAAPETAVEKLEQLEQCIGECESGCDKVFRSIVQTRVSLLNIMTPTM